MTEITQFTRLFDRISHGHGYSSTFTDFLDASICCLSNRAYEEEYLAIAKRYGKDRMLLMSELFAVLVTQMDNEGQGLVDVLGEFYQQHISMGKLGQYFTPETITDFMASITGVEGLSGKSIQDPACGSGRMLLSAAKNIGRNNTFYGADLDPVCCRMAAVNLCLNGLVGEIAWMNSLSQEHWGGYQIRIERFSVGLCPVIKKLSAGEGLLAAEPAFMRRKDNKGHQLDLF